MSNNVIIPIVYAKLTHFNNFMAERLIVVPRPTVDRCIEYSDPIVADKRRRLGYGMEPEDCLHVREYVNLCL